MTRNPLLQTTLVNDQTFTDGWFLINTKMIALFHVWGRDRSFKHDIRRSHARDITHRKALRK